MLSRGTKHACFPNHTPKFTKSVNIISDSFSFGLDSKFTSFRTCSNTLLLIYTDIENNLIFYDLEKNHVIKKTKSHHNENVSLICHYNNLKTKKDLIATVSTMDVNAYIWSCSSFNLFAKLESIYDKGNIASSCFIGHNNKIYLTFGINNNNLSDKIKIININDKEILTINNKNYPTVKIAGFSHQKKTFIIVCTEKNVISYDFDTLSVYKEYNENEDTSVIYDLQLLLFDNNPKLLDIVVGGNFRLWDFYSKQLILKVKYFNAFASIYVWNKYLFICDCPNCYICDLRNFKIIYKFSFSNVRWKIINVIMHKKYRKCLLYIIEDGIGILYD